MAEELTDYQFMLLLRHAIATKKRIPEIESMVLKSNFCTQYVIRAMGVTLKLERDPIVDPGETPIVMVGPNSIFDSHGHPVLATQASSPTYINEDYVTLYTSDRIDLDRVAREYLKKELQ